VTGRLPTVVALGAVRGSRLLVQATTLTLVDETPTGETIRESELVLDGERITLRQVITQRVRDEAARFNRRRKTLFQGLVQPNDAEHVQDGYRLPKWRKLDPELQSHRALSAFLANRFFVLVDDRQVADLDQVLVVRPGTRIAFIKMVPLVGG